VAHRGGVPVPRRDVEEDDADVTPRPAHHVEEVALPWPFQGIAGDAKESALERELSQLGVTVGRRQDHRPTAKPIPNAYPERTWVRGYEFRRENAWLAIFR